MKKFAIFILIILSFFSSNAQHIKDSSITVPLFKLQYSFQMPSGDMKERFGLNSNVGASFLLKLKSNIIIGYDYSFIFSNNVKEDYILDYITTSDGHLINQLGMYSDILINERGFFTGPQIGYQISFNKPNPNSGIYFILSGGILQHKINIQNKNEDTPQILDDYLKGYDRLTNGFALKETLGFMYLDNRSKINFFAALDFYQGWTQSRREIDFYSQTKDTKKRLDLLLGFKFGWIIPFQKGMDVTNYYY